MQDAAGAQGSAAGASSNLVVGFWCDFRMGFSPRAAVGACWESRSGCLPSHGDGGMWRCVALSRWPEGQGGTQRCHRLPPPPPAWERCHVAVSAQALGKASRRVCPLARGGASTPSPVPRAGIMLFTPKKSECFLLGDLCIPILPAFSTGFTSSSHHVRQELPSPLRLSLIHI